MAFNRVGVRSAVSERWPQQSGPSYFSHSLDDHHPLPIIDNSACFDVANFVVAPSSPLLIETGKADANETMDSIITKDVTVKSASSSQSATLPLSYRSVSRALANGSSEFFLAQNDNDTDGQEKDDDPTSISDPEPKLSATLIDVGDDERDFDEDDSNKSINHDHSPCPTETETSATQTQEIRPKSKRKELPLLLLPSPSPPSFECYLGDTCQPPPNASSVASNSLYDSDDKIIFSRSTSNYSESLGESITFIKNLVLVALVPYSLIGISTIAIDSLVESGERISSSSQWRRYLRATPKLMLANGLELGIVLLIDVYLLYLFVHSFLAWMVETSVGSQELIAFLIDVYEIMPIIGAMNLFWWKGYYLGPILQTIQGRIAYTPTAEMSEASQSLVKVAASVACVLITLVGDVVSYEWKASKRYALKERNDFYYHQAVRLFILWLLTTHLTVLSGVHYRVVSLNNYIQTLTEQSSTIGISVFDFQKIKNLYKQNAELICKVNRVFDLMVSDIIIVIFISILKDMLHLYLLYSAIGSYSSLEESGIQANGELIAHATKWIVIDALTIVTRLLLVAISFKKAIQTNRDIKLIGVVLNDLASGYIEKPSEIYQSFSLTKSYIDARLDRSDDPAVIRLYAAKWIPCLHLA